MRKLTFLVLLCAAPAFAAATESDLYQSYVDQAIPLSFDMAKADAQWRESLLYFKRLSDAQQSLAHASESATEISRLIPLVPALLKECPKNADGSYDNLTAFRDVAVYSQLQAARESLERDVSSFTNQSADLSHACEHGFESYSIDQLNLTYDEVSVDNWDGVYVGYSNEEPWQIVASVGESLVQLVTNANEQGNIEVQQHRLQDGKVKSKDYQLFAKQACQALMKGFELWFANYKPLSVSLDETLAKLSSDSISSSVRALNGCLEQSAQKVATDAESQVLQSIQAQFIGQKSEDTNRALSIHANMRIFQNLAKLKSLDCGKAGDTLRQVQSDISLIELYGLSGRDTVLPQAQQSLAARSKKCGGAYL